MDENHSSSTLMQLSLAINPLRLYIIAHSSTNEIVEIEFLTELIISCKT